MKFILVGFALSVGWIIAQWTMNLIQALWTTNKDKIPNIRIVK